MISYKLLVPALGFAVCALVAPPAAADRISHPTAVFSGLDKITGRIISFEVATGETVQFGSLQITEKACYTRPATEAPQTTTVAQRRDASRAGRGVAKNAEANSLGRTASPSRGATRSSDARPRRLVPAALQSMDGRPVGLHLHNTRNTGYANAIAGFEHGWSARR